MTAGLPILSGDVRLLFAARIVRLFAYGFVSVVLALYLAAPASSFTTGATLVVDGGQIAG